MAETLLYVSKSLLELSETQEVDALVEAVPSRNAALDVTGALVFTGTYFAQILEGRAEGLAELMASIRRDKRHKDVVVLRQNAVAGRRFAGWSMAYAAHSFYFDRHIKPSLRDSFADDQSAGPNAELVRLMEQFAARTG